MAGTSRPPPGKGPPRPWTLAQDLTGVGGGVLVYGLFEFVARGQRISGAIYNQVLQRFGSSKDECGLLKGKEEIRFSLSQVSRRS